MPWATGDDERWFALFKTMFFAGKKVEEGKFADEVVVLESGPRWELDGWQVGEDPVNSFELQQRTRFPKKKSSRLSITGRYIRHSWDCVSLFLADIETTAENNHVRLHSTEPEGTTCFSKCVERYIYIKWKPSGDSDSR
jgi:hypothetical protein